MKTNIIWYVYRPLEFGFSKMFIEIYYHFSNVFFSLIYRNLLNILWDFCQWYMLWIYYQSMSSFDSCFNFLNGIFLWTEFFFFFNIVKLITYCLVVSAFLSPIPFYLVLPWLLRIYNNFWQLVRQAHPTNLPFSDVYWLCINS